MKETKLLTKDTENAFSDVTTEQSPNVGKEMDIQVHSNMTRSSLSMSYYSENSQRTEQLKNAEAAQGMSSNRGKSVRIRADMSAET